MPNILEKKNKSDQLDSLESNQTLDSSDQNLELNNPTPEEKSKGLMTIIGQCLPFAPMLFEQWTGQKIPQITGTIADIKTSVDQSAANSQQLTSSLSQVISNQKQIFQRIVNLENSASNHLISLDKRIENLANLKLTHERERKQIEPNQPASLEQNEYQ